MRSRQLKSGGLGEPYEVNAPVAEAPDTNGYESMTKAELQDELSSRDLPITGNKPDLIARLEENDAE